MDKGGVRVRVRVRTVTSVRDFKWRIGHKQFSRDTAAISSSAAATAATATATAAAAAAFFR